MSAAHSSRFSAARRRRGRSWRGRNNRASCRPSATSAAAGQQASAHGVTPLFSGCASSAGSRAAPSRSSTAGGMATPSDDAIRLHQAEAELERLRGIVRNQEQALRVAGKVLSPYLNRLSVRV